MSPSSPTLDPQLAHERLGRGPALVGALFEGLTAEVVRWKPAAQRWSLLEIVNHLADEEVLDFRTRVRLTLESPAADWPPIAPQQWVSERGYALRDPDESLQRFLLERRRSLEWLASLGRTAPWNNVHVHPKFGEFRALGLLANWVAHDLLHARQMLRVHHEYLAQLARPLSLDYAGPLS